MRVIQALRRATMSWAETAPLTAMTGVRKSIRIASNRENKDMAHVRGHRRKGTPKAVLGLLWRRENEA